MAEHQKNEILVLTIYIGCTAMYLVHSSAKISAVCLVHEGWGNGKGGNLMAFRKGKQKVTFIYVNMYIQPTKKFIPVLISHLNCTWSIHFREPVHSAN